MRLDQFLIGLLLFSLIVVAGSMVFYNVNVDYGNTPNMTKFGGAEENTGTYAILDEMNDDIAVEGASRLLGEESTDVSEDDQAASESLLAGGFRVLKLIPKSFRLVSSIITDIATNLKLPSIFVTFLFATLVLSIVFSVVMLIWRLNQ